MERITSNRPWEEAQYDMANEKGYSKIWLRLNMIEDILGEDYDIDRLRELVEADLDGRCVVLPEGDYSDKDGENALKTAMRVVSFHNDPVTRYIADAVAEKLASQDAETALKGVERMNQTQKKSMKPMGSMPVSLPWQAMNLDIQIRLSGDLPPETQL